MRKVSREREGSRLVATRPSLLGDDGGEVVDLALGSSERTESGFCCAASLLVLAVSV